ncbi:MAG TPA: hypothetical protein PKB14_02895 [Rubrivivax sp.]|nr:hypothetical protein [Rubrivivax sp.]
MRSATGEQGNQLHVMSAAGHQSKAAYTRRMVCGLSADYSGEVKRTNEIDTAQHGCTAARCHRRRRAQHHRRCAADPARSGRLRGGGAGRTFTSSPKGNQPTSRLRRFAISVLDLHAKPGDSIASMTRRLAANTRPLFGCLLMTKNSTGHGAAA